MANLDLRWILLTIIVCLIIEGSLVREASATESSTPTPTNTSAATPTPTEPVQLNVNFNDTSDFGRLPPDSNRELLKRMLYVAVGLSILIAVYFIFKTIQTRRRKSKSKKYGVIHTTGDLEMQPLDREDDDEDDMTVFDRKAGK
ncbi:predicted protein [Nematostella vectensis]|uniref:Uncharacterized protein n=1 Tax=Nematostella vectensis TaxID=45351 RepID=A7SSL4_NEMVE|nr:membrane protein FAM174 [Nematostella vectensis]EDO33306.1 predicted protein [Nematostella vectensis]|eukprot:XP_001625406.1 predicted protein [Nematostella vectensis]